MLKLRRATILAIATLLGVATLAGQAHYPEDRRQSTPFQPPGGIVAHRDLIYASVGGRDLHLDLYVPEAAPMPLVVWIHRGGWRRGSKEALGRLPPIF